MKSRSAGWLHIATVMPLAAVWMVVACAQAKEERAKDEPTFAPWDSGASSGSPPRLEPDKDWQTTDAAVSIDGGQCLAREDSPCEGGRVPLRRIGTDCNSRVREGLCGTTLFYNVDEQGCVSVVDGDYVTENTINCIAELLGSQRWSCAEEGPHRVLVTCGPP